MPKLGVKQEATSFALVSDGPETTDAGIEPVLGGGELPSTRARPSHGSLLSSAAQFANCPNPNATEDKRSDRTLVAHSRISTLCVILTGCSKRSETVEGLEARL